MKPANKGTIASTSPTRRTSDRPIEGGLPRGAVNTHTEQPHPRRLPCGAPEEDEVRSRDQQPAGCEQCADEPLRTQASDQRCDERGDPDYRHEEHERHCCVGRERDRARRDPAVERALGSRRAADDLFGPIVESRGGGTNPADHLVGKTGCLSGDRVPEFGTRGDVAESALRLVACEHLVRELERLRARERSIDEPLQFSACGELGSDAFEHAVADERARDLLRQRTGERPVEDAGDLGRRQHFVYRLFERPTPGACGCPCRVESDPSGRVGESGALLLVL